MKNIHHTAVVNSKAMIESDVKIGPYCVVGKDVTLRSGVELVSHVCIDGITDIGENTKIFPFASIGLVPQDKKYQGEASYLIIGKNNCIREYVTMNPGTAGDKMETRVADNCLFMAGSHVAHDCIIGNNVIMANNATLGGHVTVGDYAIIGGLAAVHQFVRIGAYAIVGGMSGVSSDVIPFGKVVGDRASLDGLNIVGLKRHQFDREVIRNLRHIYSVLFKNNNDTFATRLDAIEQEYNNDRIIMEVIQFLKNHSDRAICFPRERC